MLLLINGKCISPAWLMPHVLSTVFSQSFDDLVADHVDFADL